MAFITAGSEFNGNENLEFILRPIFTGQDVTQQGFRVDFTRNQSVKLSFIDAQEKILIAYSNGFQGGTDTTKRQKKLELEEFKAEQSYSKQQYKGLIQYEIVNRGGVSQNDIEGTDVHAAEVNVFFAGIKSDVFRIFWLGDKLKKTFIPATSSNDDAVPDVNYNVIDGVWTKLIAESSLTPGLNDVLRVAIANGTTAQVDTVTLTGTSGTANIQINNVDYLATFDTDLTTTATNFVTAHAAALLLLGVIVTSSTVDVILTATPAGQAFITDSILNVSGDLAGSIVLTTANVGPAALGTDEARNAMKTMITTADQKLKMLISTGMLRYFATDSWIENYQETLEADGTEQAHRNQVDGIDRLFYRGIPLIPMGIDGHLSTDFASPYPHRCILTVPDNITLVISSRTDFGETRFWFNPDENENRQRAQFEFGADYILPEWIVAAF